MVTINQHQDINTDICRIQIKVAESEFPLTKLNESFSQQITTDCLKNTFSKYRLVYSDSKMKTEQ